MKKVLISLFLILLLTGCDNKTYKNGEVNVLNWSSYIPNDVIRDFEEEYDIKVNYGTYSSNEELLAKITSSKEGTYDLIFPSDYMIQLMKEKGIIKRIDKTKLSNYDNINKLFLGQHYDVKNHFSIPFLAATVVIAVNRENITDEIDSYNDLLNEKYKNNIVLLDDQRIVIGMALKASGYRMNEVNKTRLNTAKDWLLDLKDNVKAFDSDSPKTFLITNEVDIGVMWNAEAILAKEYNNNIEIIYPKEGHAISIDNYAITKGSKNEDNAYLLIDYLLRDDISKKIVEDYPYISTNHSANDMSNYELKKIIDNGNYVENIGEKISLYDKLWAEIK